jgi:hypothetical protein
MGKRPGGMWQCVSERRRAWQSVSEHRRVRQSASEHGRAQVLWRGPGSVRA